MAIQYIYFKHSFVYQIRIKYYSVPTIHEYRRPNIFVPDKFPNTEDRIVLFGPNYSRIPKNRSIRCNSEIYRRIGHTLSLCVECHTTDALVVLCIVMMKTRW